MHTNNHKVASSKTSPLEAHLFKEIWQKSEGNYLSCVTNGEFYFSYKTMYSYFSVCIYWKAADMGDTFWFLRDKDN